MRGWVKLRDRRRVTFRFERRWDLSGPLHVTFYPNTVSYHPTDNIIYEEDFSDDVPVGKVLRIVLGKPRIREYDDRVEVVYVLRVFYTYGGSEITFTHVMSPETFQSLQIPPCWTMSVTAKDEAKTIRPWICSPVPYRVVTLTDGMINTINPS